MLRGTTGIVAGLLLVLGSGAPAPALAATVPTITAVSSSLNPSLQGDSVTFTSTTTSAGSPLTTGAIDWSYQPLGGAVTSGGSASLNASGQTTFTTSAFSLGSTLVRAFYPGSSDYFSSDGSIFQTVNAPPPPSMVTLTLLSSSLSPSQFGELVTFTSRTIFEGFAPTGDVTFRAFLNNVMVETFATTIGADGFASFSTSTLPVGNLFVIAAYAGDALHFGSDGALSQQVLEAVPEPATWALMLAGLGVLGAGLRRRA